MKALSKLRAGITHRLTDRHQDLKSCIFLAKNSMIYKSEYVHQLLPFFLASKIPAWYTFAISPTQLRKSGLQFITATLQRKHNISFIIKSKSNAQVQWRLYTDVMQCALWNPFNWEARAGDHKSLKPVFALSFQVSGECIGTVNSTYSQST